MLVSEIIMKKKHKSLLVLLSLLMLAFLFFPARSEAQVNSGSSRVSYSFAEYPDGMVMMVHPDSSSAGFVSHEKLKNDKLW